MENVAVWQMRRAQQWLKATSTSLHLTPSQSGLMLYLLITWSYCHQVPTTHISHSHQPQTVTSLYLENKQQHTTGWNLYSLMHL
jgi:hypothetical protein